MNRRQLLSCLPAGALASCFAFSFRARAATAQGDAPAGSPEETAKRQRLRKLGMRVFLRGQKRRKDLTPEKIAAIDNALKTPAMLDALCEECETQAREGNAKFDWTAFLKWLVEHADEIIELIISLLPLFFDESMANAKAWNSTVASHTDTTIEFITAGLPKWHPYL